jgi:hypothetical protein
LKKLPGYQAPISAEGMAKYIYDFTLTGNAYFNGKVLQCLLPILNNSLERYLAKFLPDHAIKPAFELIVTHGVHLKNERATRHGDYRKGIVGNTK